MHLVVPILSLEARKSSVTSSTDFRAYSSVFDPRFALGVSHPIFSHSVTQLSLDFLLMVAGIGSFISSGITLLVSQASPRYEV